MLTTGAQLRCLHCSDLESPRDLGMLPAQGALRTPVPYGRGGMMTVQLKTRGDRLR